MNADFYRAFEDRFRGERSLIRIRLEAYHRFVKPLASLMERPRALDLGCGRGEWLEVLGHLGFDAHGVDLNQSMLQSCRLRGLQVDHCDAATAVGREEEAGCAVISGFHLAEHLPFEDLQQLFRQARRALAPGGLLILETPNPENLMVGTKWFYQDPTHRHPLPPDLLQFLACYHGFVRVAICRLQEPAMIREKMDPSLMNVLDSVSPDYCMVAQKAGPRAVMEQTAAAFAQRSGVDLMTLAHRYESHQQARFGQLDDRLARAEHRLSELSLVALPLRWPVSLVRRLVDRLLRQTSVRAAVKRVLKLTSQWLRHDAARQERLLVWLRRFPPVYHRLLRFEIEQAAQRPSVCAEQSVICQRKSGVLHGGGLSLYDQLIGTSADAERGAD